MNKVRDLLAFITVALMTLGYAGSQVASLAGDPNDWSHRLDQSSVVLLSLVLFLAAICFAFVKDEGDSPSS